MKLKNFCENLAVKMKVKISNTMVKRKMLKILRIMTRSKKSQKRMRRVMTAHQTLVKSNLCFDLNRGNYRFRQTRTKMATNYATSSTKLKNIK